MQRLPSSSFFFKKKIAKDHLLLAAWNLLYQSRLPSLWLWLIIE